MDDRDELLRTELMESILSYLEGSRPLRSVLVLGITAHSRRPSKNQNIADVVSQLNYIGNQIANGNTFSKEYIKESFTTFLEKLTKD